MAVPVLVVTPSPGFGELISQILHEAGGYECALATSGPRAVQSAEAHGPTLCVLDGDLDEPLSTLANDLREKSPGLLLVVIPPDTEDAGPDLSEIKADAIVSKPFYLPDLISTVEDLFKAKPQGAADVAAARPAATPEPTTEPAPEWLQDVNLAAQHLTRLSLESASQASLIARGEEVWAYAGELPKAAAEELARTLGQHWSGGGGSDLARFVRLEATGSDYMLYATDLGGGFVLAMVFDTETPFSKIRTQASSLAERLSSLPADEILPAESEPDTEPLMLQPLLDDVPPPIPNDWIPNRQSGSPRKAFMEELLEDAAPAGGGFSQETSPALRRPVEESAGVEVVFDENLAETIPSAQPDVALETAASAVDYAPTVPSRSVQAEGELARLQPASPTLVNLTYSCVLIPRLPDHFLTGDLAAKLSEWLTQLCLAFGWRLEQLSMRPEYLQWMVNVSPQTSPAYLMRIIRQHTSRRLFTEFPRFAESNPSGDFWAPGYFMMSGTQPPQPQLIKDFIKDTRTRQGIKK